MRYHQKDRQIVSVNVKNLIVQAIEKSKTMDEEPPGKKTTTMRSSTTIIANTLASLHKFAIPTAISLSLVQASI